jgi:hypothetical protein
VIDKIQQFHAHHYQHDKKGKPKKNALSASLATEQFSQQRHKDQN